MKQEFIEHLKDNNFEHTVERDGSEFLVAIVDAETGEKTITMVFDGDGTLRDIWNNAKEELQELKDQTALDKEDVELGKAVKSIAKLFK